MKGIFLYIVFSVTPFEGDTKDLEMKMEMRDMPSCEKALKDLNVDGYNGYSTKHGRLFQIMGTKILFNVRCIDTRSDIV